jgi:hypothetical protein
MRARRIATGRRLTIVALTYLAERGVPRIPTDQAPNEAVVYLTNSGGATWSFKRDSAELSRL